jgi:phosphoadenosine phosphosulfate reductase
LHSPHDRHGAAEAAWHQKKDEGRMPVKSTTNAEFVAPHGAIQSIQLQPSVRRRRQPPFSPAELREAARPLDDQPPQAVLCWALAAFRRRITLACSFGGPSGMVLLDMVMRLEPKVPVYYLDTDLLFPETYTLVEEVTRRYGVHPKAVRTALSIGQQAARYGDALWARDPDRCCALRKVQPQYVALRRYDAWITGLRRDQSTTRRETPVVAWDAKFGLAKVCPLAAWTERDVWRYLAEHHVPYNALHGRGYASIGCTHCTRPIADEEDLRAGRWSESEKVECGLHTTA